MKYAIITAITLEATMANAQNIYHDAAPAAFTQQFASMPNSVRALYGTFQSTSFPWRKKELLIEAWGQLCFDAAANNAIAYHMWNHDIRSGWKFLSWRVEMDGEPVGGGKL